MAAAHVDGAGELFELRAELAHHEEQLFLVREVADEPRGFRELEVLRLLQHDERAGAVFEGDPLRVHFPRGERSLDEAGLAGADAHRFHGHVFLDADRAVDRLDLGVDARVLDHEIAGRLDGELSVVIDADFRSAGNDHRREICLVRR
jgi:hypothetical protein